MEKSVSRFIAFTCNVSQFGVRVRGRVGVSVLPLDMAAAANGKRGGGGGKSRLAVGASKLLLTNDLAQKSCVRSAISDSRGGWPRKRGEGASRPGDEGRCGPPPPPTLAPLLLLTLVRGGLAGEAKFGGALPRERPSKLSARSELEDRRRGDGGEDKREVEEVSGGGGGGGKS
jgi:hypothetical protein